MRWMSSIAVVISCMGLFGLAALAVTRRTKEVRPLQTRWLDQSFAGLYDEERRMGRFLTLFSSIAILIACVGLYGLAAHAAQARTREIGVRKAFGATASGLTTKLTADFLVQVAVGLGVGVPLAWWLTGKWLQDFAYRVEVGPATFVIAGVLVTVVAALTVSHQSIRAALTDPVKTLRCE